MQTQPSLAGKVAIVTGGSRGIGAAIAERLAHAGAAVAVNYRADGQAADSVRSRIEAAGGRAFVVQGDVSREEDARRIVAETVERFGHVDILVNNAGGSSGFRAVGEIDAAYLRQVFETNVYGTIHVTQAALAHFPQAGGSIVNLSSRITATPHAKLSLYCAAKSAIEQLTRTWAIELGPRGIRVNAVSPGAVETDANSSLMSEEAKAYIRRATPLGRIGQPSDIAAGVAFLVSEDGCWMTGKVLAMDGGMHP